MPLRPLSRRRAALGAKENEPCATESSFLFIAAGLSLGLAAAAVAQPANPVVVIKTSQGRHHHRALRRQGAPHGPELPGLRRRQVLRRHHLPPGHQGLHDPGRRHDRRHEREADPGRHQQRGDQQAEEPARHHRHGPHAEPPHTATAQFFINHVDNASLDHKNTSQTGFGYCVFGKVITGMDVVDAIAGRADGDRQRLRGRAPADGDHPVRPAGPVGREGSRHGRPIEPARRYALRPFPPGPADRRRRARRGCRWSKANTWRFLVILCCLAIYYFVVLDKPVRLEIARRRSLRGRALKERPPNMKSLRLGVLAIILGRRSGRRPRGPSRNPSRPTWPRPWP